MVTTECSLFTFRVFSPELGQLAHESQCKGCIRCCKWNIYEQQRSRKESTNFLCQAHVYCHRDCQGHEPCASLSVASVRRGPGEMCLKCPTSAGPLSGLSGARSEHFRLSCPLCMDARTDGRSTSLQLSSVL